MTLLHFRIEGKTPCEKETVEQLNSSDNWFEISLLNSFKIFVGILLGPTAFSGLRVKIIFLIYFNLFLILYQEENHEICF